MAERYIAVFGIYADPLDAGAGVDTLKIAGFRKSDISALFPDNPGTKDFAHEKNSKAPEGAVTGGASGAVLGAALGWLAGIGAFSIPGVGPLIAAGPIISLLSGVGVGGTVGGLAGALIGAGIPEYEAKRYEGRIRKGGILLSVHCDDPDWVRRAERVLAETGAEDIAAASEARVHVAAATGSCSEKNRS